MRKSPDTCADCVKYPIQKAIANGGRAPCPEWKDTPYAMRDHDDVCVLHMHVRAENRSARAKGIEKLAEVLAQKANP